MANPVEVYIGDVIQFTFTVADPVTGSPINLGSFDAVAVVFGLVNGGGRFTVTPSLVAGGAGGICTYTSAPGQLAPAGEWRAQVVGLVGGIEYSHSSLFSFSVYTPLG